MTSLSNIANNSIFTYSYGRYLPNGVLAFGVLGFFIAVKFGLDGLDGNKLWFIPAALISILSLSVFIPQEILQIDFEKRQYRIAVMLFSKIYGSWDSLGDIKYLSIVKISKRLALSSGTSDANLKDAAIEECQLRIFIQSGKHIIIDDYQAKSSALTIAQLIAPKLNLQILDATISPAEFIDLP